MRCKVFFVVFLIFFSMSFVSAIGDDGPLIYCGDGEWDYDCEDDLIRFIINEQNMQNAISGRSVGNGEIFLDEEIYTDEFGRIKSGFSFLLIMLLSSLFLLLLLLLLIFLSSGNKMIVYK